MPDGESIELPHSLRRMEKITFGQDQVGTAAIISISFLPHELLILKIS